MTQRPAPASVPAMGEAAEIQVDGTGRRVAVVVARFNRPVTERLQQGAVDALLAAGVPPEQVEVVHVPGAFELPLASKWLAESGRFDAVVTDSVDAAYQRTLELGAAFAQKLEDAVES